MIDSITGYFMKRPVIFWSLLASLLVAGLLSYTSMPKLEDPAVSAKQAMVAVMFPGASAHEMELNVAQVVEQELRSLPDVKKVRTECQNGSAIFTVEFKMTVRQEDLEQHFDMLRRKTGAVALKLPQGCYAPVVIDDMMDVYGILYGLTAEGYDYPAMYKYAKYIQRELLAVDGVKRINLSGNRDEVINITISKENISRNGIIPTQIMSALQAAGKTVDAGRYLSDNDRIPVYVDSQLEDEKDVADLQFQTLDGNMMRIGDIATVEREYSEPQRSGFFVDGKPAIAICIAMEADAIVPDVGKAVEKRLAEVMETIPVGFRTEKIFFQPDKVNTAINSFLLNLLESVLIVVLVLIFSMGFRCGLIIGFGLLLTIAGSFPILLTMGVTLQRISLGAFIIAMGMLVDNAVVIMDGILVDKQKGYGPKTYLYNIGRKSAMPLLGATIIAAASFVSVYMSPSTAGEYASDLFLVLCVSLLLSWVLALVQVPVCSKAWLPVKHAYGKNSGGKMQELVKKAVSWLIDHKIPATVCAFIILALCVIGIPHIKNVLFSDFDTDQFIVECFFPSETSADVVRDKMLEMREDLVSNPEIKHMTISQSSAPAHYSLVRPMTSGGDCYAELMVDCKDYKAVLKQIPQVRKHLRESFPEAYIRIRKYNFSVSTTHTVEAEFSGPDPAVLRSLSAKAEEIMRACPYVDPYSVQNNWKPIGKKLVADFDQHDAARAGIGREDVGNALQAASDGLPVGVIYSGDEIVQINLRVRNEDGSRIGDMGDAPVWSMMNLHLSEDDLKSVLSGGTGMSELQDKMFRATPLSNVAKKVGLRWDDDLVLRSNGSRAIEAECDPAFDVPTATAAKAMSSVRKEIEGIELPDGYKLHWIGDSELSNEAIGQVMKYVPVSVIVILLVLLLLFNDWRKLGLILLCFPFVACGIIPALLLFRMPFTFMAIFGAIGLMGMMIKNAIVLVDEITRLCKEEKMDPYKAVVEAVASRTRPVILASLTTILGVMPLASDAMFGSMALVIMGGLTVGTIITLALLPTLYAVFFKVKKSE